MYQVFTSMLNTHSPEPPITCPLVLQAPVLEAPFLEALAGSQGEHLLGGSTSRACLTMTLKALAHPVLSPA